MFTIARPGVLWLVFLAVPAALFSYYKYRKLLHTMSGFLADNQESESIYDRLRRSSLLRGLLLCISWVSLVLALAGISFGTKNVPVQKSGNAVSMVFDISWSMTAKDEQGVVSRLEAVKSYAHSLVGQLDGDSISVVLAKGDGIIAVPLTEDVSAVDSVLESLDPNLMSSSGSSIGKGIEAAISTFPHNSAQSFNVWVFTDGDETDTEMKDAFKEAVKFGIPVTVIGFGSREGRTIIAGDGKTEVHTRLQDEKILEYAASANSQSVIPQFGKPGKKQFIRYVAASSKGSASGLIKSLSGKSSDKDDEDFVYEVQSIPRYGIFLLIGIAAFILSIIAERFSLSRFSGSGKNSSMLVLLIVTPFIFGSCSGNFDGSRKILQGTWNYHQQEYQESVQAFYQTMMACEAEKNDYVKPYAVFGLAATYLMQDEDEVAVERIKTIPSSANPELLSRAYYNLGIIASRQGNYEEAQTYFKKSILYDSRNADAKINLELSDKMAVSTRTKSAEKQMTAVREEKGNASLEQAVFNLIKEEEQNKWKNLQTGKKDNSVIDY